MWLSLFKLLFLVFAARFIRVSRISAIPQTNTLTSTLSMIFVTLKLKVFSCWLCVDKQITIPHLPFIVSPYGGLIWAIDDDEVSAAANTCSGGQYFPSQSLGSSAKKNAPKSSLNRGLRRLIVTPVWGGLQISRFTLGNSVMQQNYIHLICSPSRLILKGQSKCLAFCYFFSGSI